MYANMDDDELIFEENVKMENISSFLNTNYDIKDETLDYKTGLTFLDFKKKKMNMKM